MSGKIHTCSFDSGRCNLCGATETEEKQSPRFGPVTWLQVEHLIKALETIAVAMVWISFFLLPTCALIAIAILAHYLSK